MSKLISQTQKAYLAGFLDGDGSVYVQLKPNKSYKYGFQVAMYIVFYQSQKSQKSFEKICSLIGFGHMRVRKDGILEYIIGTQEGIEKLIKMVDQYVIMKNPQVQLLKKIVVLKNQINSQKDFRELAKLIDTFRELNYSKKRKVHTLTP